MSTNARVFLSFFSRVQKDCCILRGDEFGKIMERPYAILIRILAMTRQGSIFSVLAAPIIAATSAWLLAALLAACFCCSSVAAAELPWMDDLEKAKKVAAEQHKDLLINFTSTSWCSWCVRLEREILSADEFAPAADKFVLVRLDYPRHAPLGARDWSRLPQEPPPPIRTWAEQYGVGTWQTMFLADAEGIPYATVKAFDFEPAELVDNLAELRQVHQQRDEAFAAAAKSEGASRTKHLLTGLKFLREAFADASRSNVYPLFHFYRSEFEEVVRLGCGDELANDKTFPFGEQIALCRGIAGYLGQIGRTEEAIAICDEMIDEAEGNGPHEKYNALMTKSDVYWHAHRFQEALETHDAAMKRTWPGAPRSAYGDIRRIQILSRLGRAQDAWKVYDEFAQSRVSKPQSRLLAMSSIARQLDEAGSSEAAHDAALMTQQAIESLEEPGVDPSRAQETVDSILAPSRQRVRNWRPESSKL